MLTTHTPDRRQFGATVLGAGFFGISSVRGAANATPRHAATAVPVPPEILAALPAAQLIGSGTYRYFGLRIYDIRLWAAPGFQAPRYDTESLALALVYARSLDGAAIAERSITEMRRIAPPNASFAAVQAKTWQTFMQSAFPNVVAQDRIVGFGNGAGGVQFFHNGRATAKVTDQEFTKLFFGIWLSPQTSDQALRQSLIASASP